MASRNENRRYGRGWDRDDEGWGTPGSRGRGDYGQGGSDLGRKGYSGRGQQQYGQGGSSSWGRDYTEDRGSYQENRGFSGGSGRGDYGRGNYGSYSEGGRGYSGGSSGDYS